MPDRQIRGANAGRKTGDGLVATNQVAYVEANKATGIAYRNPPTQDEDGNDKFYGLETVTLVLAKMKSKINFRLTDMTAEELRCFKQMLDFAFDQALPICEQADQEALKQHTEGVNTSARLYRRVPLFSTTERGERKYHSGVPIGLDGLRGVETPTAGIQPGERGAGCEDVAEQQPADLGSQDDSPEGEQSS